MIFIFLNKTKVNLAGFVKLCFSLNEFFMGFAHNKDLNVYNRNVDLMELYKKESSLARENLISSFLVKLCRFDSLIK